MHGEILINFDSKVLYGMCVCVCVCVCLCVCVYVCVQPRIKKKNQVKYASVILNGRASYGGTQKKKQDRQIPYFRDYKALLSVRPQFLNKIKKKS